MPILLVECRPLPWASSIDAGRQALLICFCCTCMSLIIILFAGHAPLVVSPLVSVHRHSDGLRTAEMVRQRNVWPSWTIPSRRQMLDLRLICLQLSYCTHKLF